MVNPMRSQRRAAVEGRTEQHCDEHHDADSIARPDHPAQKAVVDAGEEQHDRETQTQAEHLRLDVVEAVAHPQVARGVAGTEQHDESEHDDDCQRRQPVDEHLRPGAGARQDAKDSGFFLRMVAIRIPSLSDPGSTGPRRLQGQRKAQHCQDSKDIKDIHRVKAPLFEPAVERRGAEQLPPPPEASRR